MRRALERTVPADVASLERLHVDLVAFFAANGVPAKASHDAQVVVDELIGNAIRHALPRVGGRRAAIDVSVKLGADVVALRIRDDLPLFDPTALETAFLSRSPPSLAAAAVGGRGLALVRRLSTLFRWHADPERRNVVEVEVPIAPAGGQDVRSEG
jgi:anti-sigma regulatory factor (Ser/Thr protein kinase)